jgi:hypothetical protein
VAEAAPSSNISTTCSAAPAEWVATDGQGKSRATWIAATIES